MNHSYDIWGVIFEGKGVGDGSCFVVWAYPFCLWPRVFIVIITGIVEKEEHGCILFVTVTFNMSDPQGDFWYYASDL